MEKWVVGSAKRTYGMNDAQDPYEQKEDAIEDNVRDGNDETQSNGRRFQDTPLDFAANMRSLRAEMQSYITENERLVKAQEK